MYISAAASLSLLVVGTLAAPSQKRMARPDPPPGAPCMTREEAERVAHNFQVLQDEKFNRTLAEQAIADQFIIYNDSINTLIDQGCPVGPQTLGAPTFDSKADYFAAARLQAPTPYETLNVWNTCDTVIARWRAVTPYLGVTDVVPQVDVTGIVVIETVPNPDPESPEPWQFATIYSEFNSFSWGYDLGLWESELCAPDGTPLPPPAAKEKRGLERLR